MNPEQARALRNQLRPRPMGAGLRAGSRHHRVLHFDRAWPDQAAAAAQLLDGIERLDVMPGSQPNTLRLSYLVSDYTLQGIEAALMSQGFHLDNGFLHRLSRMFVYFGEETELRNLAVPERLIKQSNKVYSKAWEQHPHGDHDDTPPDLREQK